MRASTRVLKEVDPNLNIVSGRRRRRMTKKDWDKCAVTCPTCGRDTLKLIGPEAECPRCFLKRNDVLIEETECPKCRERVVAKVTTLSQGLLDTKIICPQCGTYPL